MAIFQQRQSAAQSTNRGGDDQRFTSGTVAVVGTTATFTVAAPTGTLPLPGVTATVTIGAQAGTTILTVVGVTATVTIAAPAGNVYARSVPPVYNPYTVRIVDAKGVIYADFGGLADITEITWELNGPGRMTFGIPTDAPNTNTILVGGQREAQVWYDTGTAVPPKCIWWGRIQRRQATDGQTQVQCVGLLDYFKSLHFGPILTDYLGGAGQFEGGSLSAWTTVGCTSSVETTIVRKGTQSAKLVSTAQGADNYISKTYAITAGSIPVAVFAAGWCYIEATAATPYIGPAYQERGLFMQTIIPGGAVEKAVWTPINNSAPRNQWFRINAPLTLSVPANTTRTVEIRAYSPGGAVRWDDVVAVIEESTGANTANGYADVTQILANVILYSQDTTKNKPALNIAPPTGTLGTVLNRQYQFYDHGTIWDACIKPLIDEGVCDVDITWNDAATKRFFNVYTKKGSTKPQLALELGGNVAGIDYVEDGTQTASSVRVLHQGFNHVITIGKEERAAIDVGYAVDTAANGGITLDVVLTAPPETPLDGLVNKANAELARRKNPVQIPTFHTHENLAGLLIGQLQVGDTVPFVASYGWVNENTNRRVVTMTLTPHDDVLSVTGN